MAARKARRSTKRSRAAAPKRAAGSRTRAAGALALRHTRPRPLGLGQTYAAAGSDKLNERHWANTDALSARAANSAAVRKKLRERGRYEGDNSCHGSGLGRTLPVNLIGNGPRLQVQTDIPAFNRQIEMVWRKWAKAAGLAAKLRTMVRARIIDGEAFALLTTNPKLRHAVKLDLRLIETEQVSTPDLSGDDPLAVDGIRFDEFGNPVEYHVLKEHPGETFATDEYIRYPAESVLHWFLCERPGQARGVCEINPALGTLAQLRRYTRAVLGTAEHNASVAGVLQTENSADDEDAPEPWDSLEFEHIHLVTTPAGAKLAALKSEQPTTTYGEFKQELLKDVGRPVQSPYNVTAGDSSPYNYSSARLDFVLVKNAWIVDRENCVDVILERTFEQFLREARLIPGLIPAEVDVADLPHAWNWPGWASIDPVKDAEADVRRLNSHTDTLANICAERGLDWEEVLRQRAKEVKLMEQLGLDIEPIAERIRTEPLSPQDDDEDKEEERPRRKEAAHA